MTKSIPWSIRFREDELARYRTMAEIRGWSVAKLIREALFNPQPITEAVVQVSENVTRLAMTKGTPFPPVVTSVLGEFSIWWAAPEPEEATR